LKKLFLLLVLIPLPCKAVPVVPNFTQGSMTAVTRTTSTVTENIVSHDYNTGHTYSLNGTNLSIDGSISPNPTSIQQTVNGTSYQWTGAELTNKPNVTITNTGQPFQYVETYVAPGLSNYTTIQRTTSIESVTETTSVFSQ
tara:strand:+ start:359 stop:781 length:423 start_codon:yes stop_codon:yes gene_type:complete